MTSVELLIYIGILNIQEFKITHCDKKQNLRKSLGFFLRNLSDGIRGIQIKSSHEKKPR